MRDPYHPLDPSEPQGLSEADRLLANIEGRAQPTIYSTECLLDENHDFSLDFVRFSTKTWDKIMNVPFYIPRQPVLAWYKMLIQFCITRNLFIPPYILFDRQVGVMGCYWPEIWQHLVQDGFEYLEQQWVSILYTQLQNPKVFPKETDFGTRARELVSSSAGNGYVAIFRIMQQHHPLLQE